MEQLMRKSKPHLQTRSNKAIWNNEIDEVYGNRLNLKKENMIKVMFINAADLLFSNLMKKL